MSLCGGLPTYEIKKEMQTRSAELGTAPPLAPVLMVPFEVPSQSQIKGLVEPRASVREWQRAGQMPKIEEKSLNRSQEIAAPALF